MCLAAGTCFPFEGAGMQDKFQLIQLSALTATKRIDNLANYVKVQLY